MLSGCISVRLSITQRLLYHIGLVTTYELPISLINQEPMHLHMAHLTTLVGIPRNAIV